MDSATAVRTFLDPDQPAAARLDALLGALTLDEKIAQMMTDAPAVPRFRIPAYSWWSECLHGAARAGRATVFPQALGMAASFHPELLEQVAAAMADEARAKHHVVLQARGSSPIYFGLTEFSPNINILRDPRWGRAQETYGEDPYLTGRLGIAFVKGLQGDHPHYLKLAATPKHYAVHSGPESERHRFDAHPSARDLHETYLPAFRACVREAGAASIMGAYSRVLGEPCCASPTLLQQILRDDWGFDGYVVSDCGAIHDIHAHHGLTRNAAESAALAVRNGCDLNVGSTYAALGDAVAQGLLTEADIDRAVRRLFAVRLRLGMFDPDERVPFRAASPACIDSPAHRDLARQMARESIVLLRNEHSLLPLSPEIGHVAVVGPVAADLRVLLGNYYGYSGRLVTLLEGIVGGVGAGTVVTYTKGCDVRGRAGSFEQGSVDTAVHGADVIVATLGFTPELEGEEGEVAAADGGGDRADIGLPGCQQELLKYLHGTGKPVVLVLTGGSPLAIPWAAANIRAILLVWYSGEEGGNALADVLFGATSPAGRLPATFVASVADLPPFADYSMRGRTYRYADGLSYTSFAYTAPGLSAGTLAAGAALEAAVRVRNTGSRAGDEVVQLYVENRNSTEVGPRHHLEGVRRLHLEPGTERQVRFQLHAEQCAVFDEAGIARHEPGPVRIWFGGGQPDDPAAGAVAIELALD